MHVVFISNCELKALARTRGLLDRYATRIGDRAWTTPITEQAMNEVWSAIRRMATRQTSVACYRNDSTHGLRLIWVVGNKSSYDRHGRFAVATQCKKAEFPMFLRHAALIAALSGYTHDLGKASARFMGKLSDSTRSKKGKDDAAATKDIIRHEWLSSWIVKNLVDDEDVSAQALYKAWSTLRSKSLPEIKQAKISSIIRDGLDAANWAVCTHHGALGGDIGKPLENRDAKHVRSGIPTDNLTLGISDGFHPAKAPQDAARWTGLFEEIRKSIERISKIHRTDAYWEGVMLAARAALIMADHKVSSEAFRGKREDGIFYANTKKLDPGARLPDGSKPRSGQIRYLDQPLSHHLLEVGSRAPAYIRMLAGDELPFVDPSLVRATLDTRAPEKSRFSWQDRAADHVATLGGGKLIFNVASTGAGKTIGNLKMAFALNPSQPRLAVAFNLRSLTTQTFAAFLRHLKGLDGFSPDVFERDFACLLGDRGSITMDFSKEDEDDVDQEDMVHLEGGKVTPPSWLAEIASRGSDKKLASLIASPVLVSTMDWIVACGEPGQQDRHAKALIRVANSDLILDEVDSYDVKAAVAVVRVVQTAATFGRNVIVSSATLNPELARGISLAYASGWRAHCAMTAPSSWQQVIVHDDPEFSPATLASPDVGAADDFYRNTMKQICRLIESHPATKRYRIAEFQGESGFYDEIANQAALLHEAHGLTSPGLKCRLSIGLVRVANVGPCMEVSDRLRDDGRFVVTAYHARDTSVRRAWKERWLDLILSRGDDAWIQHLIEAEPWIKESTGDVRLVVVATPVEEVGRDHDFDWAIIEPSSMHSIIQTAGRVNRHRRAEVTAGHQNIVLLGRNLKAVQGRDKAVFIRPGLESTDHPHPSHEMTSLMKPSSGAQSNDMINSTLVFDAEGAKTVFAGYDEESVRMKIEAAIPVIERRDGYETGFMLESYPRAYPLRENDPSRDYEINLDEQKAYLRSASRGAVGSASIRVHGIPERTWLSITPDDEQLPKQPHMVSIRTSTVTKLELKWNGVLAKA